MNKQELIEKLEERKTIIGNFQGYAVWWEDVKEIFEELLDEPSSGHAEEAPRYVKNILARLRELPLHDREVWLKAIMGEFERDFSHAKWREGYEQGKFEGMIESEKVKIPKFVADYISYNKGWNQTLHSALANASNEVLSWFCENKLYRQNTFARAWLDSYEVEKEKQYKIVMPNISSTGGVLTRIEHNDSWIWIDTLGTIVEGRIHTREELEEAGFGWVFNCPGIQIEEVE
jgi:hypothetical protein